jgi:hypothetical protein
VEAIPSASPAAVDNYDSTTNNKKKEATKQSLQTKEAGVVKSKGSSEIKKKRNKKDKVDTAFNDEDSVYASFYGLISHRPRNEVENEEEEKEEDLEGDGGGSITGENKEVRSSAWEEYVFITDPTANKINAVAQHVKATSSLCDASNTAQKDYRSGRGSGSDKVSSSPSYLSDDWETVNLHDQESGHGWWRDLDIANYGDALLLHWETDCLQRWTASCAAFQSSLPALTLSTAVGAARSKALALVRGEVYKRTLSAPLHSLLTATQWPAAILARVSELDSPWAVILDRAQQVLNYYEE